MFAEAVAGINDAGIDALAQQFRRAPGAVADNDNIDTHRFEVARGIEQRFALADGTVFFGEFDDVGA